MHGVGENDSRFGLAGGGALRVLHLSTFDDIDGAARGALWLHRALRAGGCQSEMMVGRKRGTEPAVRALPGRVERYWTAIRMKFDDVPLRRYGSYGAMASFWTVGWLPSRIAAIAKRIKPDIVHLHWVGAGFLPIQALKQFRCPVVWTLRDMWPLTGGCHYSGDCNRYERGCGACPQLHSERENDLSRVIWNRKRQYWPNADLWLVPISNWLADCVRASPLLSPCPVEVIPNGVDLDCFRPSEKSQARERCKLPANRSIVVYGAVRATRDPRKGFRELLAALQQLRAMTAPDPPMLVVFGDLRPGDLPDIGIESRYLGYIDDDRRLAQLYAGADVAVVPSLQEAFGKTVVEAMACGTPVVAFNAGGPRDIVDHRVNGYLAEPYSVGDLAHGITWCLDEGRRNAELGQRARAKVESKFDIDTIAARYHALYRTASAARRERSPVDMTARFANA